jgi:hypothetical protein
MFVPIKKKEMENEEIIAMKSKMRTNGYFIISSTDRRRIDSIILISMT